MRSVDYAPAVTGNHGTGPHSGRCRNEERELDYNTNAGRSATVDKTLDTAITGSREWAQGGREASYRAGRRRGQIEGRRWPDAAVAGSRE
ncbi:hypothetical protein V491_05672 [Pseudogymnoascus sp. VKM F-3775]|nr:hypothetical protein V491_05672 [Pseudogymnoascus sp. VKM F-3775]